MKKSILFLVLLISFFLLPSIVHALSLRKIIPLDVLSNFLNNILGTSGTTTDVIYAGFRSSPYGYQTQQPPSWWVNAASWMSSKVSNSNPTIIWILGEIMTPDQPKVCKLYFPSLGGTYQNIVFNSNDVAEQYLSTFDANGIKVWLQVEPGDANMTQLIDLVMGRYKNHPSVIGFGVDLEWFYYSTYNSADSPGRPVTDAEAQAWLNEVKKYNSNYKLFLKHWITSKMPPTFRNKDLVFIDDSEDNGNFQNMINEFKSWGNAFSSSDVGFQFGYPSDKSWWSQLSDPAGQIANTLISNIPNTKGVYWVDFSITDVYNPTTCSCGSWTNGACGGSCSSGYRQQTRTCTPSGCTPTDGLGTTRCVADSSCISTAQFQVNADMSKTIGTNKLQIGTQLDYGNSIGLNALRQGLMKNASIALVRSFDWYIGYPNSQACTSWNDAIKTGTFNWQYVDQFVDSVFKAGAEPMIVLGFADTSGNGLAHLPNGMSRNSTTLLPNPDEFAAYATAWVNHFASTGRPVRFYQIVNEPFMYLGWSPNAARLTYYASLYNKTYNAMKALNSNLIISQDFDAQQTVLDYFINNNVKIDAIDYHKYDSGNANTSSSSYETDSKLFKDAEIEYFVNGHPFVRSPSNAQTYYQTKTGRSIIIINSESNLNSAWNGGTDSRNVMMSGAVWDALKIRMDVLNNVSYDVHFTFIGSKSYETSKTPFGGYGFGMIDSDSNKPYYPYWLYYMIFNNLKVEDKLYSSSSSSSNLRTLAWVDGNTNNLLIIHNSTTTDTIQVTGFSGALKYSKIDNSISFLNSAIQTGTIDASSITLNGYTVMLLQSSTTSTSSTTTSPTTTTITTTTTISPTTVLPSQYSVGYWNFDEGSGSTAYDSSPFKNTATLYNNPAWVTGKFNQALQFSGSNYVEVPDSSSLDLSSQVTITAWINPSSIGAYNRIVAKSYTSNANPWTMYGLLFDNANHIRLEIATNGQQNAVNGLTVIPLNQWTFVAGTYDGTIMKVYVNGNLDNSVSHSGLIDANNMPLSIGRSGFNYDYFKGMIDEVKVWNRALTADEIKNEYEGTQTCSIVTTFSSGRQYAHFYDPYNQGSPSKATNPPFNYVTTQIFSSVTPSGDLICRHASCAVDDWGDRGADWAGIENMLRKMKGWGVYPVLRIWLANLDMSDQEWMSTREDGTVDGNPRTCGCVSGYICQSDGTCKQLQNSQPRITYSAMVNFLTKLENLTEVIGFKNIIFVPAWEFNQENVGTSNRWGVGGSYRNWYITPQAYAEFMGNLTKARNAVAPRIRIGVAVDGGAGDVPCTTNPNWNNIWNNNKNKWFDPYLEGFKKLNYSFDVFGITYYPRAGAGNPCLTQNYISSYLGENYTGKIVNYLGIQDKTFIIYEYNVFGTPRADADFIQKTYNGIKSAIDKNIVNYEALCWYYAPNDIQSLNQLAQQYYDYPLTSSCSGFTSNNFICNYVQTNNLWECSLDYTNNLGEKGLVKFYFIDSLSGEVKSTGSIWTNTGSSGTIGSELSCYDYHGTYNVVWRAYRSSDTAHSNPVAFSTTFKSVTC